MKKLHDLLYNRFVFLAGILVFAIFLGMDLVHGAWGWAIVDAIFILFDIFVFTDYTKLWGHENV